MSGNQYKVALTHAILAGTSLVCLYKIHADRWKWALGSFGIIAVNSLLGVFKFGNPAYGDKADVPYQVTEWGVSLFSLAGVAMDISLNYSEDSSYTIMQGVAPLVVFLVAFINSEMDFQVIDSVNIGQVISFSVISIMHKNHYGLSTALSFTVNQFFLRNNNVGEVPKYVLYNLGTCFYCFFALRALGESCLI